MDIVCKLTPKPDFDMIKFVDELSNHGIMDASKFELTMVTSAVDEFRGEFVKFILTHSYTALLERGPITEAFVGKGTSKGAIVQIVHSFLQNLGPMTEMVIIDPYFFVRDDPAYLQAVEDVLRPVLPSLSELVFVVDQKNHDSAASAGVFSRLSGINSKLILAVKNSSNFHDRYWINRTGNVGFVMGSSLNGIGRKHALIDNLQQQDAIDILKALVNEGII